MQDLNVTRKELDELDAQLIQLLEKRLALSEDVATYKIANDKPVLDKDRELYKLKRAKEMATGEYNKKCVEDLMVQVMAMSRRLQYGMMQKKGLSRELSFDKVDKVVKEHCKVVYQGVEGAYSQAAMWEYFGSDVDCHNVEHWRDGMEDIANKKADFGVFPIENSTAGSVTDVYDLLMEFDNTIVAEQIIPIRHALLGLPGAKIEEIRMVCSHPQALSQSAGFINAHGWEKMPVLNTAVAAKMVLEEQDVTRAAIASRYAAKVHNLQILQDGINDSDVNSTRFIVVSNRKIYTKEASKVSICFELPHEKGTLYNMISNFIFNDLNMTKIESRPIRDRNWEYRFFVDFEGNLDDDAVRNALTAIESEANSLRVLGNY